MRANDEQRAVAVLLGLMALGVVFRLVTGPPEGAPGAVRLPLGEDVSRDSVAARARMLRRPLQPGERFDLNSADRIALMRLPRIGPSLADRIVRDREANGPFPEVAALERVSGIGPAMMRSVGPHLRVEGSGRRFPSGPGPVRVNAASAEELTRLPGIGAAKAAAIVAFRRRHGPFRSIDELQRVPGIGPATVERLREHVRVP